MAETAKEVFDRLEEWVLTIEDAPDVEYYACSMDTQHSEFCSESTDDESGEPGPRTYTYTDDTDGQLFPCFPMSRWDIGIAHEDKKWELAGIHKEGVKHDIYNLDVMLQTLVDVLLNVLNVPFDVINEMYQKKLYTSMHDFREKIEPHINKTQIETFRGLPGILGSNGKPLGEG